MNFLDAKAIISPDSPVVPGSKEHDDILKLMRQSRVFAEDNVPAVPIRMTSLYLPAREYVSTTPKPVSKKDMVVKPQPKISNIVEYEFAEYKSGMSKKEFMKIKRNVIIENGSDERRAEIQASGAAEGGACPSEGSA
jgi:hypothetical protein